MNKKTNIASDMTTRHIRNYALARIGPGGIHCMCCTPFKHSYLKRFINRVMRRKSKSEVKSGVIFNQ